jgi:hypothetical protein
MFVPRRKHTYGPQRPIRWMALPFYVLMMIVPYWKRLRTSTAYCKESFTCLYVDDVRTSKETNLGSSVVCYADSSIFLCIDGVRTSVETHLWASTACYGDSFTYLFVDDVRTSLETHLSAPTACYGHSFSFHLFVTFSSLIALSLSMHTASS